VLRALVLALTVLTGFSGLVYEVAWQKALATLLGSHGEATAAVLALFLGGLALGYALFGRVTGGAMQRAAARGRAPRLLLLYGAVEAGIGVHALAFPWLFAGVRALSTAIPHPPAGPGFALDVALSGLLILPACVLMGGTIPLLTQALARGVADATRVHAWVYACNTTGAFLGALAGGLMLVPWLGLEQGIRAMGVVNLVAGAALGLLGLRPRAATPAEPAIAGAAPAALGAFAASALLLGFSAMVLQTVLIRLGGLALGSSQFTFAMGVALFVLCLALGSFAVSALPAIGARLLVGAQWSLAALLAGLHPVLENAPWAAHVVRTWFRDEPEAFYPYHLAVFLGGLAVLAVPIGLSGAMLPLLFHHLRRGTGDLGAAAGRLYAWNTVGSLLGALLGGYLLLYWFDLHHASRLAVAAVAVSAALVTVRVLALPPLPVALLVLAPALVGIALLPDWRPERLASGAFRLRARIPVDYRPSRFFDQLTRGSDVVFHDDDPHGTVTVTATPHAGGIDHAIVTNGKPDGSIRIDYPTMALAALVPALFADRAERAFVIGYGTGVTVGELGTLDSMQRVTVVEISPAVIEAGRFFEADNQGALANPRTVIRVSDAYRALLRSDERFDVIVSEPSNPWVTGVEMLYSREFLAAARDRLRPGGVYCQWFHVYENDTAVVELVLRTYASVFDHVAVWYALGPDLLLLGFDDPRHALDVERLRARASRPDFDAALRRAGIASLPALLAHELLPLGVVNAAGLPGDLQTLLHPVLSLRAARAFFVGRPAALPPTVRLAPARRGAEHALLRRFVDAQGAPLSDAQHAELAAETCEGVPPACATRLAWWAHQHPDSARRDEMLRHLRARPGLEARLAPARLRELEALFDSDGRRGSTTPEEAARLTELFVEHYLHATPFSRDALAAVWRRCRDDATGGARCLQGLARAEEQLGPLRRADRSGGPGRSPG
jgi:spermidine synthase